MCPCNEQSEMISVEKVKKKRKTEIPNQTDQLMKPQHSLKDTVDVQYDCGTKLHCILEH